KFRLAPSLPACFAINSQSDARSRYFSMVGDRFRSMTRAFLQKRRSAVPCASFDLRNTLAGRGVPGDLSVKRGTTRLGNGGSTKGPVLAPIAPKGATERAESGHRLR